MDAVQFSEARIAQMASRVAAYFTSERQMYLPHSESVSGAPRKSIEPYFSVQLLDKVKTLTLHEARIPPPPFYAEALRVAGGRFPDFVHMASVTFVDVIVFHDRIEPRTLFHGMVHAAQMEILGVERYVDFYVRGFVKNLSWLAIPLEDQAYKLDARFAESPDEAFSVENEIMSSLQQGRYE